jgi:hypothetical protein
MDTKSPKSIHHFRTHQYRVFLAGPYFKLDLEEEIKWHEGHLKKLRLQARNPHLFHRERTSQPVDEHRERHFREHVIESIPFHEKILSEHQRRLNALLELMPKKTYKRLQEISMDLDAVGDYLVYDRLSKRFFFVIDRPSPEKERWADRVRRKRICDVMALQ